MYTIFIFIFVREQGVRHFVKSCSKRKYWVGRTNHGQVIMLTKNIAKVGLCPVKLDAHKAYYDRMGMIFIFLRENYA